LKRQAQRFPTGLTERVEKGVADTVEGAGKVGAAPLRPGQPVGGGGMVSAFEVFADLFSGKSRAVEGRVGAFAVGFDVERLAGRVVQEGGEFAFPEVGVGGRGGVHGKKIQGFAPGSRYDKGLMAGGGIAA
jgi:hypothetical protein